MAVEYRRTLSKGAENEERKDRQERWGSKTTTAGISRTYEELEGALSY
jgi:hypothetical protein